MTSYNVFASIDILVDDRDAAIESVVEALCQGKLTHYVGAGI